jgi:hypothetical protein
MTALKIALFLFVLTAMPQSMAAAIRSDELGGVPPLVRGDSPGIAAVLRELHLGNVQLHRFDRRPVAWLRVPTEIYAGRGKRLQFHHYSSPMTARAAKDLLLRRLRVPQKVLAEPSHVTRCGRLVVLEFGAGDAVIGAADQNCEHPISVAPYLNIERHRGATQLLDALAREGVVVRPFDAWWPLPERKPGFAYVLPSGYLYLHASPNVAQARRAREEWADQTPNEFPANRQWAYRCGSLLVVFDERLSSSVNTLLRRRCGDAIVGRAVIRE